MDKKQLELLQDDLNMLNYNIWHIEDIAQILNQIIYEPGNLESRHIFALSETLCYSIKTTLEDFQLLRDFHKLY